MHPGQPCDKQDNLYDYEAMDEQERARRGLGKRQKSSKLRPPKQDSRKRKAEGTIEGPARNTRSNPVGELSKEGLHGDDDMKESGHQEEAEGKVSKQPGGKKPSSKKVNSDKKESSQSTTLPTGRAKKPAGCYR